MDNKLVCPICSEPSRVYMGNARKDRLCGKHADMLKNGEISVNENGLFVDSKTNKILNKDYVENKEEDNPIVVKCIACGKETQNGNLFCKPCYYKYKDKQLLVKITKCKEFNILDESYESIYTCKDGHRVKSKSEREIDDYLFENCIPHAYEKVISIDCDSSHDLHPDFYLPKFRDKGDVYIEHWGFNSNNKDYTKSRKYKVEQYKKLGLTVICTNEKDQVDIIAALNRKLKFFEVGKVNFDEE